LIATDKLSLAIMFIS